MLNIHHAQMLFDENSFEWYREVNAQSTQFQEQLKPKKKLTYMSCL